MENNQEIQTEARFRSSAAYGYVARRGFVCIGLDNPKFTENVGGVMRIAGNYNVNLIAISGKRYKQFKKQPTDTMKACRHIPLLENDNLKNLIPHNCVPVAVDLIEDAIPLTKYIHPQRAFYIFGAEDATLGERVTEWCRDIIYVPTNRCMNLAVTVAVVLYDRLCKSAT